jgi:hypothetical protein
MRQSRFAEIRIVKANYPAAYADKLRSHAMLNLHHIS